MNMTRSGQPSAVPGSRYQRLSFTRHKLPPAWRVTVFLTAVLLVTGFLVALLGSLGVRSASGAFWDPRRYLTAEVVTLVVVVASTLAFIRREHRAPAEVGLRARSVLATALEGSVWGLAASTLLVGVIFLLHGYSIQGLHTHGSRLLAYLVLWLGGFALLGLAEELTWRAYPLATLAERFGFWPAAVTLSIVFGALHLTKAGGSVADVLSVALFGLFWCYTVRQTGAIWFAVGFHGAFNFFSLYVYGSRNGGELLPGRLLESHFTGAAWLTGGHAGAEASLLAFPLIALLFVALRVRHPKARAIAAS